LNRYSAAVWDVAAGGVVREYDGSQFETQVLDGQWSPDGTRIVVSDEKGQWCIFGTGSGQGWHFSHTDTHFSPRYFAVKTPVDDSQYKCIQSM
jgi:PH-interacting protein